MSAAPPRSHRRSAGALGATAVSIWRFVAGEDWRSALGVLTALALTALLTALLGSAWWAMALCVALLLVDSLRRSARPG